jgi:demethylmenaquinone methyltransferase / 2-methoxy-6-polyprenyl-1,4-benzoquinol methylase
MAETENKDKSFSFGYEKVSAHEKEKRVHDHFDSIAEKYDWMNTLLSLGLHYPWKRAAVRMGDIKEGDRVLDACGGTADLALLALGSDPRTLAPLRRCQDASRSLVVVYDMNRAMMEVGARKADAAGTGDRIVFVEGDLEKLSCGDESFDVAMVAFGIRNLVHPEEGLKEMYRALKPGGRFICLEFSRDVTWWFKPLYDFYSFAIMPFLGRLLAGSRKAYTYLPQSIRVFATPDELSATLRNIGFSNVTHRRLTQGIAIIHRAEKTG